jgi:glucose/arabinose dehydrogenase
VITKIAAFFTLCVIAVNAFSEAESHELRPPSRPVTPDLVKKLKVPEGFQIGIFAKDLKKPRMMAVGKDNTVYVTQPQTGDVMAIRDKDGDGEADEEKTVAKNLPKVHGIAIHEGKLYLATPREVLVAEIEKDGKLGDPKKIIENLPEGQGHAYRTIEFGPDGMLYISVGSTCNICEEDNPEYATILRVKPDGSDRKIFASGLRNTIGFGWHPETKEMWGVDNGVDGLGDNIPPEELNRLIEGKNYGWPYVYGDRKVDPRFANAQKLTPEFVQKSEPPVFTYTPHTAPIWMMFYSGDHFPQEYKNDAFAAFHGSWNRIPAAGFEVVRIHFDHGRPVEIKSFVSGFLIENGEAQFGRPAGLAQMKDGSLLISDDSNGVIYRLRYQKDARRAER